jgi:hypothetical protein
VRVDHLHGRSVADTDAMAALTRRTHWSVRTLCERKEEGYDVKTCEAVLEANPVEPKLITAAQAQHLHDIPAGHVRQWAYRGRLVSYQTDGQGFPLYDETAVLALHAATIEYKKQRQKRRTS